jgi:hypothetical protein
MEAIYRILGIPPEAREARRAVGVKIHTVRRRLIELAHDDSEIPVVLLMLAMSECRVSGASPAGIILGLSLIYGVPIEAQFGDPWMAPALPHGQDGKPVPQEVPPPDAALRPLDEIQLVDTLVTVVRDWIDADRRSGVDGPQPLNMNWRALRDRFVVALQHAPAVEPGDTGKRTH